MTERNSKMPMEMLAVSSSNVVSIGYDPDSQILGVEFKNGTYHYYGVPENIYSLLLDAPSKGIFVNTYIKNQYPCDKVG